MKFDKGDLILVKTINEKKITCIVVSLFQDDQYIYVYCMETGKYRLVYNKEVEFIVTKGFDTSFPDDPDLFSLDYSFYDPYGDEFGYVPYFTSPIFTSDEDEEDS